MNKMNYQFSNDWFENGAKPVWNELIPKLNPNRILEIGAYEGASTCYLIETLSAAGKIEIHIIDSWEGGIEHKDGGVAQAQMDIIEERFHQNISVAQGFVKNNVEVVIHKSYSDLALSKLITDGKQNYFDFIYIDGSHQAPDVLCDAVLSFRLLKIGGVMVFDDYLWQESLSYGTDPIRCPKPAIDAFVNLYCRKVKVISAPLYQLYVQKIAD
jgi:predicted O-methyltransferase YrrM